MTTSAGPVSRASRKRGRNLGRRRVIGGGLMGLTAAYLLKNAGRTVAVLERGALREASSTGHTTAHLTAVTDLRLFELRQSLARRGPGRVGCRRRARSTRSLRHIRAGGIACDFRWVPGHLHAPLEGAERSTRGN